LSKKSFQSLFLLLVFVSSHSFLIGQEAPFQVKVFNNRDGFFSPEVLCTFQDSRSFLWIGGIDGITRFDGKEFVQFGEKQGLKDPYTYVISESIKGNLWLGNRKGIARFDGESFQNYPFPESKLLHEPVHSIVQTKDGSIFAASKEGLFCVSFKQKKLRKLNGKSILGLQLVDGRFFYVSTPDGLFECTLNGKITRKLLSGKITRFIKTKRHGLWCTEGGTLKRLYNGKWLKKSDVLEPVQQIVPLSSGQIVVCCRPSRMYIQTGNKFMPIDLSKQLLNAELIHFSEDSQGNFWMCSTIGLVRLKKVNYTEESFPFRNNSPVSALSRGPQGSLYLGSINGLYHHDRKKWKLLRPSPDPSECFITALTYSQKRVYIGTFSGSVYELRKGKFIKLVSSTQPNCVYAITSDESGNLWVARGTDLVRLNQHGTRRFFLGKGYTQQLLKRSNGEIWAANFSKVVAFVKGKQETILSAKGTSGAYVTVTEDQRGIVWIGTYGNGLIRYKNGKIRYFTREDGICDNYISSCVYDANNNALWVGTSNGISRITLDQNSDITEFHDYLNEPSNEHFTCVQNAALKDYDGSLLFSVGMNLYRFKPHLYLSEKKTSPLLLSSVMVNHVPMEKSTFKQHRFDRWSGLPLALSLSQSEKDLDFELTPINLSQASDFVYSWKLIGYKEEWTPWTAHSIASFTNLSSGEYTFIGRFKTRRGTMGQTLPYTFTITEPFYFSSWFALSMSIGIITLLISLTHFRTKRLKKKELVELVNLRRIAESELKALRAQMNPHFMFNALNAIQDMILNEEQQSSGEYLSDFAHLMRMILENSSKKFITLEREMEFIKLYLKFEQLRFSERFEVHFKVDPLIEEHCTNLPAMLIQPYIENAINHGILQQESFGRLHIEFSMIQRSTDNHLLCVVQDNGIGRSLAQKRQAERGRPHASLSTKITSDRIELLNSIDGKDAYSIRIFDLYSEGIAQGTRVEIEIAQVEQP